MGHKLGTDAAWRRAGAARLAYCALVTDTRNPMRTQGRGPRIRDWIARVICLGLALTFGALAALAYRGAHTALFWACAAIALALLAAGSVASREFRRELLAWLPWL